MLAEPTANVFSVHHQIQHLINIATDNVFSTMFSRPKFYLWFQSLPPKATSSQYEMEVMQNVSMPFSQMSI